MPYRPDFKRRRNEDDDEHRRKLFVGGLSYETKKEDLDEYFESYGQIVDSVVMLYPDSKRSRGFGFVTFDKADIVDAVQESRPHTINGREVETKRATPREITSKDSQLTVKKLFIGGVPEGSSEEDIRIGCEEFGTVTLVEIMKSHDTGKPRGFAFVTYDDYDSVDKACIKGFVEIIGKQVDVKKAVPKFSERSARGGRDKFGFGGGRGGRREERFGRDRYDDDSRYRGRSRSPVYDRPQRSGGFSSGGGGGGGSSGASYGAQSGGADVLSNLNNLAPALSVLGNLVGLLNQQPGNQAAPPANNPNPLNQLMSALQSGSGGSSGGGNMSYAGDQRSTSYPERPAQQYSSYGGSGASSFNSGYSSAFSTGYGSGR